MATATDQWGWAIVFGFLGFLAFLLTPSERPPRYGLDHEFGVEDPDFLPTVAGATGVALSDGNSIEILNNGCRFYPAMLDAIGQAKRSITIEAYIYWAGDIGLEFARALAERSAAGVQVKLLLDSLGSATIGDEILEILEGGRCQLAWYNPIRWYSLERFNHRTHRKSLIIDGRLAFTGGAGIADHWNGDAHDSEHWRDIQVRMEGPCVAPLQTGFAHNWTQTTSELIAGESFYPQLEPAGGLRAMTVMSSPEVGASTVRTMYYLSIACARRTIYIANPYFVPDEVAVQALIEAHRRGVDVRILVSGIHNDSRVARYNSLRLCGPLLRAGIRMYEYNRTMMHQKIMIVDGFWATVGTTNFDNRSFSHNDENNVCVADRPWAEELQAVFMRDLAVSDALTLDRWERRSLKTRMLGVWASLIEEQS
jgi:cardiolipin synthase